MVIKASSGGEIGRLVDALGSSDEVRREAAIARLAIIGPRAVDRLVAAYNAAADRDTRVAILRALEAARDRRTVPIARAAMARGGDEAIAGAAALRGLLDSPHDRTAADALDALMSAALDSSAERRVRLAAFDALQEMPADIRERVAAAFEADGGKVSGAEAAPLAAWADALEGRLPDDPALVRDLVQTRGASAPLSQLRSLIDLVRAREQASRGAAKRAAWQGVRGTLHQTLALRGSRVAVYDLRESLEEGRGELPASFLAALHVVGDQSCLPALAAAHAAAADSPWRQQVSAAFHAIAKRERITKRHAVMKRIAAKWPEIF